MPPDAGCGCDGQTVAGRIRTPPRLVRHQHRSGHLTQQRPRRTAQHHLTQSRMSVAAHDDKVGVQLRRLVQQHIPSGKTTAGNPPYRHIQPMPGEVLGLVDFGKVGYLRSSE